MYSLIPTPQTLKYEKFDDVRSQTRILMLESGNFQDEICGNLKIISLKRKPLNLYHAISYCWGDRSELFTITVDGMPFKVTKSLISGGQVCCVF